MLPKESLPSQGSVKALLATGAAVHVAPPLVLKARNMSLDASQFDTTAMLFGFVRSIAIAVSDSFPPRRLTLTFGPTVTTWPEASAGKRAQRPTASRERVNDITDLVATGLAHGTRRCGGEP